nr:MAG TPA: hypothetical protein [Caudoviricetes sp.]
MFPWRHWRTSEDFWILFLGVIIKSNHLMVLLTFQLNGCPASSLVPPRC